MRAIRAWRYNLILLMVLTAVNPCLLQAQSGTSSALSGDVTDASGAAVSNATVTATDVNTKATRSGATDAAGHFLFSQVNPGTYQVMVEANGFAMSKSEPTPVGVGRTVALNFSLRVQSNNQSIEVTAQQGLLSLDNPNTTTTIDAKSIKNLPNPGQDLTYLAQFAQGALMNTAGSSNDAKAAGGYGNVEFNGLPATSNGSGKQHEITGDRYVRTSSMEIQLHSLVGLTVVNSCLLQAQSGTSSALSGEVTDASGAAVPNATVTATDVNTKATRTGATDAAGHFLFSQINPGTYQVTVEASGFAISKSEPTAVGVGRTVALNFSLRVQSNSQTVEVTAQQGLLSLDNPNTTTTIDAKVIKNLPNPGQDLTYLAQFAQGALMNTAGSSNDAKAAGGYGNVEFNGLPATSNGYILDGYDTNDPWLGLNIGLSTNLVIGLDAVQEATVNTNSFSVDQGRYAVAQINYFTKSGTNAFHGDVYEIWNGSLFNAENYFLHANDTTDNTAKKPRSTVNEFGVSVGGPIRREKLFFFGHYEGIRIALPIVSQITLPTPAYQQYVLGQLAVGGTDPVTSISLPAQPAEIPFYQKMFSLLPVPGGSPVPIVGCPLGTNGDGCASQRQASLNNSDSENLIVVKIDHTINAKDSIWYRFQQDTGLQAAYTDPINPIFNSYSPQPQRTLVVGYTHLFSPTLVNQFNPGSSWYASIFEPNNYSQVQQTFPIVLACGSSSVPFTTIGGNNNTYPQGRKVTQWQINDNLTWTHGKHTWKFGINTRRLDVSNYDLGEGTVPTVTYNDLAQFTYGAAYTASQSFPVSLKERVSSGNLEYYAMDTYKPSPKVTLTAGMRVTWNTNVTSAKDLFSRTAGSFLDASHETNQPFNQVVLGNVHNLFPGTPLFVYQPRVSFAYQLLSHTAVHGGFGTFNDIIPMQIADLAAINAPNDPTFVGGIGGQVGGIAIAPGAPGSAIDAAVNANSSFQTTFRAGGAPCVGIQPGAPTCPLAVSLNTFPTGTLKTPYYYQYNLGIEQQIGTRGNLRADFVGTRGLHEPFQVQLNG